MTIDIEALINEVDEDGSGEIEFDEFKELLAGGPAGDGEDGDDDGGRLLMGEKAYAWDKTPDGDFGLESGEVEETGDKP